jgi:hypothetical protein
MWMFIYMYVCMYTAGLRRGYGDSRDRYNHQALCIKTKTERSSNSSNTAGTAAAAAAAAERRNRRNKDEAGAA